MAIEGRNDAPATGVLQPGGNVGALQRLQVGTTFQSWQDVCRAIVDHGVASEWVIVIVIVKKDKTRYLAKCKMYTTEDVDKQCKWSLRVVVKASTEEITITQANLVHTCEIGDHYSRRMHNNSNRLADHIMKIIIKNRYTRASSLRDTT